ncbi:GFA family protein [uncultured Ruegeria sp.]|uniref:GFA family protein n=2 Tax=uncultured Ruegeria sp. TaxID=259304 RepID=UPI00261D1D9C|nr:GFA family protein [uncultured Ruegeria sp.]
MVCPKPPYAGACLCGAVRVKVTASPLLTLACHCRDCHKFSASAYSLTTMFPSDSFSYTGEVIKGGRHSSGRTHFFCASCLNFIYSRIEGADWRVNLRTSVLDQAASFEPFVELMTDEKMPWVDVPVAHSFSQFPQSLDDLQALLDGYAEWWQRSGGTDEPTRRS